jgi:hypothetical protein
MKSRLVSITNFHTVPTFDMNRFFGSSQFSISDRERARQRNPQRCFTTATVFLVFLIIWISDPQLDFGKGRIIIIKMSCAPHINIKVYKLINYNYNVTYNSYFIKMIEFIRTENL